MRVGSALPDSTLRTATGEPVELGEFLDHTPVLQCLRYYG